MQAVDAQLVRRDAGLVQLLDPPFDKGTLDPGYIQGYVPGVRENGGQYTHAAIWTAMAFAALGDRRRAWDVLNLINPARHALTAEGVATYKVEPYVVSADVYALAPHTGRGGWSWYTGSAGWMYRLLLEALLGLQITVGRLRFVPCLPADWPEFSIDYRYRETPYHIVVSQTPSGAEARMGVSRLTLDGVEQAGQSLLLVDDGQPHQVTVTLAALAGPPGETF
jgi:cellobiose phosphorylase